MYYSIAAAVTAIFLYLMTQTMIFYPKSTEAVFDKKYSSTEDFWYKKEGNKKIVVALHGMYSDPTVYQHLVPEITKEGYDFYAPTLPNSALTTEELMAQDPYQWDDSLRVALKKILAHSGTYDEVVLLGHSQGGSLAMTLAPSLPFLKKLVIVASPISLVNKDLGFKKNLQVIFSGFMHFNKRHGIAMTNQADPALKDWYFALTIHSFKLGLRRTFKNLHKIDTPTLLVYEKYDQTVPYSNSDKIMTQIPHVERVTFSTPLSPDVPGSRHDILNFDPIKADAIKEIVNFITKK
ncbi:MAG: alpha/beta hydrolase [Brevinema sp.]